jgi:hypothetical protein
VRREFGWNRAALRPESQAGIRGFLFLKSRRPKDRKAQKTICKPPPEEGDAKGEK